MTCRVLRCPEPSTHEKVITEEPLVTSVGMCDTHWAEVEGGAPWVVELQHDERKQQLVVLMGKDLPLRYELLGYRDHAASPDHIEVTLTLKRWDDSDELVKFVLPRERAAEFTALSRMGPDAQGM